MTYKKKYFFFMGAFFKYWLPELSMKRIHSTEGGLLPILSSPTAHETFDVEKFDCCLVLRFSFTIKI